MKIPNFENLTPNQMHELLYGTFGEKSPLKINENISDATLNNIHFFRLIEELMQRIHASQPLKLTPKGNLPTKIVKELYALNIINQDDIESGITKLSKERDVMAIHNAKLILELSGITRKVHNKLSLTKKAKKMMKAENRSRLFYEFFKTYCTQFNWGYNDGYEIEWIGAFGIGFTILLVQKYGSKERPFSFYRDKFLKAFPAVLEQIQPHRYSSSQELFGMIYEVRAFRRFLDLFGFTETWVTKENIFVKKNNAIDEVFSFKM